MKKKKHQEESNPTTALTARSFSAPWQSCLRLTQNVLAVQADVLRPPPLSIPLTIIMIGRLRSRYRPSRHLGNCEAYRYDFSKDKSTENLTEQ